MAEQPIFITRRGFVVGTAATLAGLRISPASADDNQTAASARSLTDADWKKKLSPAAYAALRRGETEAPHSSPLADQEHDGSYVCAGCDLPLFRSDDKFSAGTGWPSFYKIIDGAVVTQPDHKEAQERTEYHCARCLGHQGYLFSDGPQPWGLRYSNNGISLKFIPA